MCSKNFGPRALTSALFFIILCCSTFAQTNAVSEAWKTPAKANSENQDKTLQTKSNSPSAVNTEAIIKDENQKDTKQAQPPAATVASAWSAKPAVAPAEPTVKPANPALGLEEKIALAEAEKVEKAASATPEEELAGVEPPRAFKATAYSLRGRTRSGTYVRRGVIAADPRVLPLGSVVHLKAGNYSGVYTVRDTGGAIKGKIIDVWMPSSREARTFGRRSVKLTVLKYGRGGKKANH